MRISDWSSDVCSSDLIDFETKLCAKPSAPELRKKELAKKGYDVRPIAFGTNTDPFQPIEAKWRVARACMEVLAECSHPFTITTKSDRVTSVLDILAPMAARQLVPVMTSITSLPPELARTLGPRPPTDRKSAAKGKGVAERVE